jgi:KDO2-lipid IV(A) lauroyltransferase
VSAREERDSLSARLSVQAFRAAEWAAPRVSYRTGTAVSRWIGDALHAALPSARANVARNLGRVLGDHDEGPLVDLAVRDAFRAYCLYWFETFHVRGMAPRDLFAMTEFVGLENLQSAVDGGRGGLMALPHLGNWDAAGRWVTASGYRMTAVAEELKPESAYRLFYRHRRALGMGIVGLGDAKVGDELIRLLSENELICLVADRDLSGRGVEVEMFGERTQLPAGPAMLSLVTGAPLMPSATYHRDDGGWQIVVGAPIHVERTDSFRDDVTALTRLLGEHFERGIAASPTAWHMFQDYWPAR